MGKMPETDIQPPRGDLFFNGGNWPWLTPTVASYLPAVWCVALRILGCLACWTNCRAPGLLRAVSRGMPWRPTDFISKRGPRRPHVEPCLGSAFDLQLSADGRFDVLLHLI